MQPAAPDWLDSGFLGMRYLNGICQTASKHGLLPARHQKQMLLGSADEPAAQRRAKVSCPGSGTAINKC